MPQWDFLDFLADQGRRYKKRFDLRMRAEATALIEERGRVVGLRAKTPRKELEIHADLVVGSDGRHSDVRRLAGLHGEDYGAPMDVLWFRLSRKKGDRPGVFGPGDVAVDVRADHRVARLGVERLVGRRVKHHPVDALRQPVVAHLLQVNGDS